MAGWERSGHGKQMPASMGLIASAMGIGPGGVSSEAVAQMKRTIASSDCDGRHFVDMLDSMAVDSEQEEGHVGPLHDAAIRGKMDTCKHLVEHLGFDVNSEASDGSGYDGIARLLLSRGASVDLSSSEGTPLHVAASRGKSGVMQILLDHHADPDKVSPDLCTPMAETLCATHKKVNEFACLKFIKILVKAGADLNSTNPDTPLVIATSKGLIECVNYLLEVGVDANIPINHGGITPIEIAAKSGRRNLGFYFLSLHPFKLCQTGVLKELLLMQNQDTHSRARNPMRIATFN